MESFFCMAGLVVVDLLTFLRLVLCFGGTIFDREGVCTLVIIGVCSGLLRFTVNT